MQRSSPRSTSTATRRTRTSGAMPAIAIAEAISAGASTSIAASHAMLIAIAIASGVYAPSSSVAAAAPSARKSSRRRRSAASLEMTSTSAADSASRARTLSSKRNGVVLSSRMTNSITAGLPSSRDDCSCGIAAVRTSAIDVNACVPMRTCSMRADVAAASSGSVRVPFRTSPMCELRIAMSIASRTSPVVMFGGASSRTRTDVSSSTPPQTRTSRTPSAVRISSATRRAARSASRPRTASTRFGRAPRCIDGHTSMRPSRGSFARSGARSERSRAVFRSGSTSPRKRTVICAPFPATSPRVPTTSPSERIADSIGTTHRAVVSAGSLAALGGRESETAISGIATVAE